MQSTRRQMLQTTASAALSAALGAEAQPVGPPNLDRIEGVRPRNIIFIFADDHRYDALGCLGHPFLQTPHLDSLATNGVLYNNACVTTALCSPSRASVLTGRYAHRHGVVDNNNPIPDGTLFFPTFLRQREYATAFIGKWHMGGESDAPQPGFDHWVSFRGQGTYLPGRNTLNVNGRRVARKGYITDELTDYALDWLEKRDAQKPFFLFLSHKAVHSDFAPAERHKDRYKDAPFTPPKTMAPGTDPEGRPMWVQNQRNSFHGVDFTYHRGLDIASYYRRYCETLLAVDDSVGRLLDFLRKRNLLEDTLVVYMSDNGFAFGEHGLIDKRTAYEESLRVPLLLHCPGLFRPATRLDSVVANIDIAPTLLEAAGLKPPDAKSEYAMDGRSFLPLARGERLPWRDALLYEYYWERNFPHTPTMHAVRGERYKYIRYHGLWDTDELYDLKNDPLESRNLIADPMQAETIRRMNRQLWEILQNSEGMQIPLLADRGLGQSNRRRKNGPPAATFPPHLLMDPPEA